MSCSIKPWHLSFMNPRAAIFSFPSRVLATRDFVSPRVEFSCPSPANPRDARSQQSIDSFLQATCVHLSTMWTPPYGPTTCSLSSALGTSLLATWSTQPLGSYLVNHRVREIPGSLPPVLLIWTVLIAPRDFEVSNVEMYSSSRFTIH